MASLNYKLIIFRILAFIPAAYMLFVGFLWLTNTAVIASEFGFDYAALSDYGKNSLVRDLSAFFIASGIFFGLGGITIKYTWFFATMTLFGLAFCFNFYSISQLHTAVNPALGVELVLFMWSLGLAAMAKTQQ